MWDLWGRFRWTDVGFMGEVSVDRCGIYGGGFGGQMWDLWGRFRWTDAKEKE